MKLTATLLDEGGNLVTMDDVFWCRCPDDDRNLYRFGQVLEQGAKWSDTDPRTDQSHAFERACVSGECAIGPLDEDGCPGLELGNRAALIAEPLDGHPEVRGPRECGERIRVCVPPELSRQEAPLEELASGYREPTKVSTRAGDREDPGCLLLDGDDPEPALKIATDRPEDPEHNDASRRRQPDSDPIRSGERVADERATGDDLVGEGESEREVGVEVDDPPGLVPEVAPSDLDRSETDHDKEAESRGCGEYVRIGGEEVPELSERAHFCQLGVAERDESDMGGDEPKRPRSDPAVPMEQSILTDCSPSQGMRAMSTTMTNMRYAPVKPVSRPAAISKPPGAASEPRVSPVMTRASVTPKPRPASAANPSAIRGIGV